MNDEELRQIYDAQRAARRAALGRSHRRVQVTVTCVFDADVLGETGEAAMLAALRSDKNPTTCIAVTAGTWSATLDEKLVDVKILEITP